MRLCITTVSLLSYFGYKDFGYKGVREPFPVVQSSFRNQNGQLGVGVFSGTHLLPEAVSGGRTWQFVRAGASTTCGVTTDRRGFCWGENNVGQLGNGTQNQSAVPVAVAPPS